MKNLPRHLAFHLVRAAATALLAVVTFGAAAHAGTYYASPSGSSSNSGTSSSSPWTLDKANSTLRPGDVCVLLPGNYSTSINPATAGTGPAARITYVGSIGNPSATSVTSLTIKKAYITIKGVTGDDLGMEYPARYDSIAYCVGRSGGHFYGAKYSFIGKSTINGPFSFLLDLAQTLSGTSNCESDTLRGCAINMGQIPGWHGFKIRGYTQRCLIDSNQVTGLFVLPDGVGRIFYNSSYNTLRDNSWKFDATAYYNAGHDPWNGFVLRDSANHYLFERDTVLFGMNSNSDYRIRGQFSGSGTYPNSVADNTWRNCFYRTNSYFWVQNGLKRCTLEGNVFASQYDTPIQHGTNESTTIVHNTFWTTGQCINFGNFTGTGNEITSNIFYSTGARAVGNYGAELQFARDQTSNFVSNNNLFFSPTYTNSPGDRSIEWCCYSSSKPGPGTSWNNMTGQDGSSRYGSPMFADSSYAGLDVRLGAGSPAIGLGLGGTDAGAIPFAPAGPDVVAPAAITNLTATQTYDTSLLLTWTAPGDDGASGTARTYDLRWSAQPITESSFASATPVAVQPVPMLSGTPQSYLVLSLTPGTRYYYAIRAIDEAGNLSALSNVAGPTTTASDVTAPAKIQDLSSAP